MYLPKSEEICKNNPIYDCDGCGAKTYGWDKSGDFKREKNINLPSLKKKVMKDFGYEGLNDLIRTTKKVMDDYLSMKHKLFARVPPVEVKKIYGGPRIMIKASGIMISFYVQNKTKFRDENVHDIVFVVKFIHNKTSDGFKLVAQHNHP